MKEVWQSLNKFYFANGLAVATLVLSIVLMFFVQFKVEALHDEMQKVESEIAFFEDEVRLLEVEWVYLTRPERLRVLASRYLQNNGYALASQIKGESQIESFYLTNYRKSEVPQVFADKNQVSF